MFYRITALVYGLFGALVGHKVATWSDAPTGSMFVSAIVGALVALAIYYVLRFLRFAESAYRREMTAAPVIFKSGEEKDVPRPTFTSK